MMSVGLWGGEKTCCWNFISLNWIINAWTWLMSDYCYQKIRVSLCLSLQAWLTSINCWVGSLSGVINAGQTERFPAGLRSGSPPWTPTTLEFITSADSCKPEVTSSAILKRMMRSRLPQWGDGFRLAKQLEKPPVAGDQGRDLLVESMDETQQRRDAPTHWCHDQLGEKVHIINFKVCT